jgi:hypothetical protein
VARELENIPSGTAIATGSPVASTVASSTSENAPCGVALMWLKVIASWYLSVRPFHGTNASGSSPPASSAARS